MFAVTGTNHKYSPVEVRERLSRNKQSISSCVKGAVLVSTCNRFEVYSTKPIDLTDYVPAEFLYEYRGKEALRHLIKVSAGLDSLILGERQILGQVRSALREAEENTYLDNILKEAFELSLSRADRIHQLSRISEGKQSVGSIAIDFIKAKEGDLKNKNILIVGVGKVSALVLSYLKKESPSIVFVANRRFGKAEGFAREIGARAVRFDNLREYLANTDIVISATKSPHFIIKKETLTGLIKKNLLILDLALPRDVDPRVGDLKGITLFTMEDLEGIIKKNFEKKAKAAERLNRLIDIEADRLWRELTVSEPEPASWH